MILRGLPKFAIFYTFFAIYYCFPFRGKKERKGKKRKVLPTKKETPRAANSLKSPAFAMFPFFAAIPTNPAALLLLLHFATPKHTRPQILFILSPKSGPRSDFLPNVVQFGLFLLSALAYSKNPFYLCTSNTPKGVARSFKDFPPASLRSAGVLRHAGRASATHEELKTAFR